jgi:hypothetical protein
MGAEHKKDQVSVLRPFRPWLQADEFAEDDADDSFD